MGAIELPVIEQADPDQSVTPGRATRLDGSIESGSRPFRHIELEINTACDLDCFGCDRFSDVTAAPNMTVEQVSMFVSESLDLGWEWERIRVLGGEPTLHPQFREIVGLICDYRKHLYPKCFIQVLSNGHGKLAQHRDWMLDRGIDPHIEAKEKGVTPPWFNNTRVVPVDRDPKVGALPPCGIFGSRGCGIGLTRHGFFLDGAGASAARVAGIDIGIQSLSGVTLQAMLDQAKVLCRICGHWNDPRPGAPMVSELVSKTGKVTGSFWAKKLAEYKVRRPQLKVYGENK